MTLTRMPRIGQMYSHCLPVDARSLHTDVLCSLGVLMDPSAQPDKPFGVIGETLFLNFAPSIRAQSIFFLDTSIPRGMKSKELMACAIHLVNADSQLGRVEGWMPVFTSTMLGWITLRGYPAYTAQSFSAAWRRVSSRLAKQKRTRRMSLGAD